MYKQKQFLGENKMKRYLIKQINETKIDDELSHKVSRAKAFSCRQSLERGLYRDAGYINAENLNEVFRIGNIGNVSKGELSYCIDIIIHEISKMRKNRY